MSKLSHDQQLDHVKEQIRSYTGKKVVHSEYAFVLCPWHTESTPSARVFYGSRTKVPGYTKCYGCGNKGNWNRVAPLLGLKAFSYQPPQDEYSNNKLLPTDILSVEENFKPQKMRCRDLPKGKRWRGIKTSLLTDIGARLATFYNEDYNSWSLDSIFLPIYINGNLEGYIKARLKKHPDYPSYINARGSWSKTHGLFPYDYAVKVMVDAGYSTMVLVEGPRDALRLLSLGIPAMCILGTQSWCEDKIKILSLAPINTIVLMMDGDDAGINASEKIEPTLEPYFDNVEVFKLWAVKGSPYRKFSKLENPSKAAKEANVSLWDPCSCPIEIITSIKKKYFGVKNDSGNI